MKVLFLSLLGCLSTPSDLPSEKYDSALDREETLEANYRTIDSFTCLNPERHIQSPIGLNSLG